jgi:hypothetical protein
MNRSGRLRGSAPNFISEHFFALNLEYGIARARNEQKQGA